jgi:hypothetical protein
LEELKVARAKVVLKGALSYSRKGKTYKKGQEQEVQGEGEIAFFEGNSRFLVTRIKEPKKKAAAAPEASAPAAETAKKPAASSGSGRRSRSSRSSGGESS